MIEHDVVAPFDLQISLFFVYTFGILRMKETEGAPSSVWSKLLLGVADIPWRHILFRALLNKRRRVQEQLQ